MEKNEKKIWFVNISEYHHRTMGLFIQVQNLCCIDKSEIRVNFAPFHIFLFEIEELGTNK